RCQATKKEQQKLFFFLCFTALLKFCRNVDRWTNKAICLLNFCAFLSIVINGEQFPFLGLFYVNLWNIEIYF
ncbi:hypothetical protein P4T04_17480, partial [Bacillus badius]|uniref:hypothetical protein n=1 Tax=Bacillus badius TaxID=1455 RepID=UPI002E1BCFF1|nr:hypothetical protein [Bacillus badius]